MGGTIKIQWRRFTFYLQRFCTVQPATSLLLRQFLIVIRRARIYQCHRSFPNVTRRPTFVNKTNYSTYQTLCSAFASADAKCSRNDALKWNIIIYNTAIFSITDTCSCVLFQKRSWRIYYWNQLLQCNVVYSHIIYILTAGWLAVTSQGKQCISTKSERLTL
jgi:hypothetical protein